jgi:hypothetical protein
MTATVCPSADPLAVVSLGSEDAFVPRYLAPVVPFAPGVEDFG